jgi:hypothetical protein
LRGPALILLAALAGGCGALKPRPSDPGLSLMHPRDLGESIRVTQSLAFQKGENRFEALAVIEADAHSIAVAGLGPLGNRMMALRWDGKSLEQERDPMLPAEFPLELILRDIQLAYYPEAALRRHLETIHWVLDEKENVRSIRKKGIEIIRIAYGGVKRWSNTVVFEHRELGYVLEITPLGEDE